MVGASAGAFGLVAAFAMLYPEQSLTMFLFFIIPITMRAKFLVVLLAALGVSGLLFPPDNSPNAVHIAHAAHLGGMLAGIIFVRFAAHLNWPNLLGPPSSSVPKRLVKVLSHKSAPWGQTRQDPAEDLPAEEFLSQQVDPILDKINAHGISSLTERERRILEAARRKMGKR